MNTSIYMNMNWESIKMNEKLALFLTMSGNYALSPFKIGNMSPKMTPFVLHRGGGGYK